MSKLPADETARLFSLRQNAEMHMRRTLLATALVLGVVMAGCGGDDDDGDADTPEEASDESVEIGGVAEAGGPDAWPAPPTEERAALADTAGVPFDVQEHLAHHVHAHLDVFIDGEHRTVPAGIGIDIDSPDVKEFDQGGVVGYGGIEQCAEPCISALHTHDPTGVLHTESPEASENTLGQFFTEWDVTLDGDCVGEYCSDETAIAVYVDGEEVPLADAADIALSNAKEIAIVIGDPPSRIPDEGDFSQA